MDLPAEQTRLNVSVRLAVAADFAFLRVLRAKAYRPMIVAQFGYWDEAEQEDWFRQSFDGVEMHIAELDGVPAAMIGVVDSTDDVQIAELQVLPEHQGLGIGTTLVRAQLERARAQGVRVRLLCLKQNRARVLYERLGFVVTGETEHHVVMACHPAG